MQGSSRGTRNKAYDLPFNVRARTDSNRQPSDPKSDALSIELRTLVHYILVLSNESDYGRIS